METVLAPVPSLRPPRQDDSQAEAAIRAGGTASAPGMHLDYDSDAEKPVSFFLKKTILVPETSFVFGKTILRIQNRFRGEKQVRNSQGSLFVD